MASEHGKEEANDRLAELQERISQADQQQASPLASQWVAAPEPRTISLVAWPVALPTQASQQSTNEPMQIVTKPLPDDLLKEPEKKPTHSAPVPVAAAQADMQVAGCFDRIQAAATCQSTCTDPTFAGKMTISQFAHEKGAQAPIQYYLNGCQQTEDEFNQALNTVAVFKESKCFCPKFYEETHNNALVDRHPKNAVGEIVGGISNYWRGALIAGGY